MSKILYEVRITTDDIDINKEQIIYVLADDIVDAVHRIDKEYPNTTIKITKIQDTHATLIII